MSKTGKAPGPDVNRKQSPAAPQARSQTFNVIVKQLTIKFLGLTFDRQLIWKEVTCDILGETILGLLCLGLRVASNLHVNYMFYLSMSSYDSKNSLTPLF